LKLRLPARLLAVKTARSYCAGERAAVREKHGDVGRSAPRRRTVAELLRTAAHAAGERRRVEAEEAAEEKARREREAAAARVTYERREGVVGVEVLLEIAEERRNLLGRGRNEGSVARTSSPPTILF